MRCSAKGPSHYCFLSAGETRVVEVKRLGAVKALAMGSLDLLRKSGLDGDVVAESSNEIDPEVEWAPSVAIGFLQDTEDLEPPYDMLHR